MMRAAAVATQQDAFSARANAAEERQGIKGKKNGLLINWLINRSGFISNLCKDISFSEGAAILLRELKLVADYCELHPTSRAPSIKNRRGHDKRLSAVDAGSRPCRKRSGRERARGR